MDTLVSSPAQRPVFGMEQEVLDWLERGEKAGSESYRGLVVAAHPDDEVIGISSRLPLLDFFLHITDGSPRNLEDARKHGFENNRDYARARRREFCAALETAGTAHAEARSKCLGYSDQESSFHLVDLTLELERCFLEYEPDFILTHPYEGGHPDHDAASFAVHHACWRLLGKECDWDNESGPGCVPAILEFTSYHNGPHGMEAGTFISEGSEGTRERVIRLTPEERDRKRRLFECFATQREVLAGFSIGTERIRIAPQPDFSAPPHRGRLFYEQFSWGMDGVRWNKLAEEARQTLGCEEEPL